MLLSGRSCVMVVHRSVVNKHCTLVVCTSAMMQMGIQAACFVFGSIGVCTSAWGGCTVGHRERVACKVWVLELAY